MLRSCFALLLMAPGLAAAQSMTLSGTCPGTFDITVTGLAPNGNFALLSANGSGVAVVPGGPCAGVPLGLSSGGLSLRANLTADANGRGQLSPNLPAGACGLALQVLDLSTCTTSNYDFLPTPIISTDITQVQMGAFAQYDVVGVDAVVTAVHSEGLWAQNYGVSAQQGGVYVYLGTGWQAQWGALVPGDEVGIVGEYREYFDLTEINVLDSPSGEVLVQGAGVVTPAPAQVLLSDLVANAEAWEGVLVSVAGVQVASLPDAFGVWSITDGNVVMDVDDEIYQLAQQPPVGAQLQLVQGPLHYAFNTFRILPRDANDVQ